MSKHKKQVPPEVLKAFGFEKLTEDHGMFKKGAWRNPAFNKNPCGHQYSGLYYDPTIHSIEDFARNYTIHVIVEAEKKTKVDLKFEDLLHPTCRIVTKK